jgi:hypothetical protein
VVAGPKEKTMNEAARDIYAKYVAAYGSKENHMLSDERYRELMQQVGMPNSRGLLCVLRQCAIEAAICERQRIAQWYENDGWFLDEDEVKEQLRAPWGPDMR